MKKELLIFAGGFLAGITTTFIYVKKKILPDMRKEVEKQYKEGAEEDIFGSLSEEYRNSDIVEIVNEPEMKPVTKIKNSSKYSKDYTKCFKDNKDKVDAVSKTEVKEEKNDPLSRPGHEITGVGPYLIDGDSFDNYSDYQARTFLFFSDGVVLEDEAEEILDADPEIVFGKTAIDALKDPENAGIVYVRNDETKCDYCLELREFPFDGFDPPSPGDDWR